MSLRAVTEKSKIKSANKVAWATLTEGAIPFESVVGFRGDSGTFTVHWHPTHGFWTLLEPTREQNRYWLCFGTTNPEAARSLEITLEMNTVREGINRRIAGAFATDLEGRTFLTHSGKVGGGRTGIGKTNFLNFYTGDNVDTLLWPDGMATDVIVIGHIESPHFPAQVAYFVHEVARFKAAIAHSEEAGPEDEPSVTFSPEFEGPREPYVLSEAIASRCDHGPVIRELHRQLTQRGLQVGNDRSRDLYTAAPDGSMKLLFEAKTDNTTTSLYGGLGQLLYHGASQSHPPKLILVLPRASEDERSTRLDKLGVAILSYSWSNGTPTFDNLDQVLS
jgi:hypothetical protein